MYVKKKLNDRIAKLTGGVAVLRVGASTDFEREYLKLKAEDAVKSCKAALEEGVVGGGGMAFYRISQTIEPKTIGESILKKALTSPLKRIIKNAGKDYAEIVKGLPDTMGYDAKEDKYVDMMEVGIIDPTKVERVALENAVSSAGVFITTASCITDYVDETDKHNSSN
jgi:chaperonin GroEL